MPTHAGMQALYEIDVDLYVRAQAHIIRERLYACTSVTYTTLDPRQILKESEAARALQMGQLQALGKVCEQARELVEKLENRQD